MADQTTFFFDNQLGPDKNVVLTPSSTLRGHVDWVREFSWHNAWTPFQSSSDQYIMVDGGSTTWLGTSIFYVVVMYDNRGCDQVSIRLRQDVSDNPAGAFATTKATMTLKPAPGTDTYDDRPGMVSATIVSNSQKRYYRLAIDAADRSGLTKVPTIYGWGMYRVTIDATSVEGDYSDVQVAEETFSMRSSQGEFRTASGLVYNNRNLGPVQDFNIRFHPAYATQYVMFRDMLFNLGINKTPFPILFEGLVPPVGATPPDNIVLATVKDGTWDAERYYQDHYDTEVQFERVGRYW